MAVFPQFPNCLRGLIREFLICPKCKRFLEGFDCEVCEFNGKNHNHCWGPSAWQTIHWFAQNTRLAIPTVALPFGSVPINVLLSDGQTPKYRKKLASRALTTESRKANQQNAKQQMKRVKNGVKRVH
jgi:hypothetical protein